MSKDELADWSETAANNTDVGGISLAEGMNPAGVNNAMREMMAQLAAYYAGSAWYGIAADVPSDTLNGINESGVYAYADTDTGAPSGGSGTMAHFARSTTRGFQIASPAGATSDLSLMWREESGTSSWSAWQDIMFGVPGSKDIAHFNSSNITVSATETDGIDVAAAEYGIYLGSDGSFTASRSDGIPARMKRSNDGTLLSWYVGTTLVGSVSAAVGVVTYGSFCGSHWAQLRGGVKREILPGTILETLDRLCQWEDGKETVLPQVQVARPGSRAVYGVFSHWDEDDDMHVASLGTNSIRIAPGVKVARGDLIEAGPNGCGVVQADDVFRASTVAKITAAVKTAGYPDGSYLVPCTLHCG
jgi:hypothetical protein